MVDEPMTKLWCVRRSNRYQAPFTSSREIDCFVLKKKRAILFQNEDADILQLLKLFHPLSNKVWFPIKLNKQPLTSYETFEEFNSDNNEMMHRQQYFFSYCKTWFLLEWMQCIERGKGNHKKKCEFHIVKMCLIYF